jgi:AcrR family transcriptional regulator
VAGRTVRQPDDGGSAGHNDGAVDGRHARSQRTSQRVLEAARELFLDHGYSQTTIDAIAARAGVTGQTVLNQFGTKCEVLAAVIDQAVVGDTEPLPLRERAWFTPSEDEPTAEAFARFAATMTAILARVAPVYDVVHCASALPEVKQLLRESRRRRRADQRYLIGVLAAAGHLRHDLDTDQAADIVYGLVNEDVYLLFTVDRRWSRRRFSSWLTDTLLHQLAATPDRH